MSDQARRPGEVGRVVTGVAGLDAVLDGGLVRGGIYLVMGRPGTGKTTLGNQLCFAHVAGGGRAVYVTLLSESHARMLANLQTMKFFDPAFIGGALAYLGGYVVLREKKLAGLLELLRRVVRDSRATLLVLDGMTSAHALSDNAIALKEFLVELQVLSAMTDCTTVLLANLTSEEANGPEHSMVDGMIELSMHRNLQRTVRELEVLKFRGSGHLLGRHDLEIGEQGIVVRPRTEELFARYVTPAGDSRRRVSMGVPKLDAMLGGGVLSGSVTMLLGFAGSGKTMLANHFLSAGADADEPGLYFGFYESPERLLEGAAGVGLPLREHVERGRVELVWQPPLRFSLDALAERMLESVRQRGVKRVVIDGLDGFRQCAIYPERTLRFITALINMLRALDVTVLITEETQKLFGPEVEVRVNGMSGLVDNILLLEYLDSGAELHRLLSIVKQRGSGYETSVRELFITDRGIDLAEDARSAHLILDGAHGAELGSRRNRQPGLRSERVGPRARPPGRRR